MHWAVRDKKEPMLEAPDVNLNDQVADNCCQKDENSQGKSPSERKVLGGFEPSEEMLLSSKSPDSPGKWSVIPNASMLDACNFS